MQQLADSVLVSATFYNEAHSNGHAAYLDIERTIRKTGM